MMPLAAILALILAAIAALHAYWGAGGLWPAADERVLAGIVVGDSRMKRMPPPALCILVAAAIATTAVWPLLLVGWKETAEPYGFVKAVGYIILAVFLLRGIAGFVPAWRRKHPVEPFASLDRRYYSPLCLLIAAGYAILLQGR
jgi:hypothetical protein